MQNKINLDKYTISYFIEIQKYDFKKFYNIKDLITFKNNCLNCNSEIKEFINFLDENIFEARALQRNNHTFMRSLLAERVNTHNMINYDDLFNLIENKKIPKINIPTKNIISNKITTNKTEDILNVSLLENNFINHVNKNIFLLDENHENFENIKNSFALHYARREHFLVDTLTMQIEWLKTYTKKTEMDMLDYYYLKFIYNKALIENYKNVLSFLSYGKNIYQFKFLKNNSISYKDSTIKYIAPNDPANENWYFAISETHSFLGEDFLQLLTDDLFNDNNIKKLTAEEILVFKKIMFIAGNNNQILFILPEVNLSLIHKVLFIIHAKWDYLVSGTAMKALLISPKSEIYNIEYFKSISQYVLDKNKKLKEIYNISDKYENVVKKYIKEKIKNGEK